MPENRKDHRGRPLKVGESQRKDYSYQYRYIDPLGKRQCIYSWRLLPSDKTPQGKKEDKSLREKEKEIQIMLSQGMTGMGKHLTLNELFDYYIMNKKHKGKPLSENTVQNYKSMWNKNVRNNILGNMKILDIKKAHIIQFYNCLCEKNMSYGTIIFFNKVMSSVFNMAVDNDMISKNPTKRTLDEIEGQQKRKDALSLEQQEELLNYLYRHDRNMYRKTLFLLDTMCRVSEFAGITWGDIDMKNKIITIDHQMQYKKYGDAEYATYYIRPTKNTHTRKIPMTDAVYKILCELRKYYFIMHRDFVVDGKRDFVFYTSGGKLINDTNFNNELKRIVKEFNKTAKHPIDSISCHVLRHTGCTRFAEDGIDLKVLQYIMGHANSRITNDVYNHVNSSRAENELLNIEEKRRNRA